MLYVLSYATYYITCLESEGENCAWNTKKCTASLPLSLHQEIDFTTVGHTITAQREEVVDFTVPVIEHPATVVFQKPRKESKLMSILLPFAWNTWVAVGAATVFTWLVFYLGTWACVKVTGSKDPMTNFVESIFFIVGTLMHEGQDIVHYFFLGSNTRMPLFKAPTCVDLIQVSRN